MKFLIIGRTGTGKDTLRKILEEKYGFTFVKSSTTRKRRYPGEDTHVFLTKEEAAAVPEKEKVAVTYIKNGDEVDEYFASRQDVKKADAYIIDPDGATMLLKNMPDEQFEIVYLYAADRARQKAMAVNRAEDKAEAAKIFEARYASEDDEFSSMETMMRSTTDFCRNCHNVLPWLNIYDKDAMERLAAAIAQRMLFHNRIMIVISMLSQAGLYPRREDGLMNYHGNMVRAEELAQAAFKYPQTCADVLTAWMMMPDARMDQGQWNELHPERS